MQRALGHIPPTPTPAQATPSFEAFVSVITLFMFAYGGLTAATSLGGEARDATRTMPRGVFLGWVSALILYSLASFALFHAVPWWAVKPLVDSKHAELATTPGLIGLVAPHAVAVLVNVLVMLIVGKTVAPQMLDSSRYLFAWAQDGLLPKAFMHTAKTKAPDVALLWVLVSSICALIGHSAAYPGPRQWSIARARSSRERWPSSSSLGYCRALSSCLIRRGYSNRVSRR